MAARRAERAVGLLPGSASGLGRAGARPAARWAAALRIPAAFALGGWALGCAEAPLPELPTTAVAEGVVVHADTPDARYRLEFAGASGSTGGGAPIQAARTSVTRAGGGADLQISAARSSWDLRARSARFEGDVVVVRGEVTLRCATLDVRYADGDTIDTVVASGGVQVDRGERHARAERAELVGRTGRITLTGNPSLAEGVNALVGERIVLWLDDEKADCEGGPSGPCRLVVEGSALGR